MTEKLFFLIKFTLTNIVFALCLFSCLKRLNKTKEHATAELLLFSLGAAPAFVSLLLYYAFLCLPPLANFFYFGFISAAFAILMWLGRKEIPTNFKFILISLFPIWHKIKSGKFVSSLFPENGADRNKKLSARLFILFCLLIAIYLGLSFISVLQMPAAGHDAVEYAAQGKALLKTRHIELRNQLLDPDTGVYQPSFHAPGFSLLITWEILMNNLFGFREDLYLRSIAFYYGLLILGLQFYWLNKKNKWLALLGLLGLLSTPFFHSALIHIHIDTYRIYFLITSWIYLARAVEKPNRLSLILLGIACGFSAYAHILGAVMSIFTIFTFLLFVKGYFIDKLKYACRVAVFALATGGIHYVIDLFWGNGWIINIHI